MTIQEILRAKGRAVVTIEETRSVLDAVLRLVEHNIGGVVVAQAGRPIGILTERDILRLTAEAPGRLDTVPIGEVMTRELITATPRDELRDAMRLMSEHKIRHLPIVDEGALVGIVSIGDVVNACRQETEEENTFLRGYIQSA